MRAEKTPQIRILVVDDHPVFRLALREQVEMESHLIVIAEAEDGEDALRKAHDLHPDVIITDINLPSLNGLQLTQHIVKELPNSYVIVITGHDDDDQALYAFRAGAHGYCSKHVTAEQLIHTIQSVVRDRYVVGEQEMTSEQLHKWLGQQIEAADVKRGVVHAPYDPLSEREMEVLELVAHGLSNRQIAQRLKISPRTAQKHVASMLLKLKVESRTQAAITALHNGWIRL